MAIRVAFTDPDTGEVSPAAHLIVHDPVLRMATKQIWLQASVYASKADYDAGKAPIEVLQRVFPLADYTALRNVILGAVEPTLISRYFAGGVRTPD